MASRKTHSWNLDRKASWLVVLAFLAATTGLVLSSGRQAGTARTRTIGSERLVSWDPLPETDRAMCPWMEASASMSMVASLQQTRGSGGAALVADSARPSEQARAEVANRQPFRTIRDPYSAYAGIAVDPIRQ